MVKKLRYLLKVEVREKIREKGGLSHFVFLTFTTPDNCTDKREFERRVNNMLTGRLRTMTGACHLICRERQKRGAWHIHVIAYSQEDVRRGTKWGTDSRGRFAVIQPGRGLKPWWDLCKAVRKGYDGFDRCSAEPAGKNKDDMESVAGYLCKYITKDKQPEHRKKLITYGGKWARSTTQRVMLLTYQAALYRHSLAAYAACLKRLWPSITDGQIWATILAMLKDARRTGENIGDIFDGARRQLMKNITWGLLPGMEQEFSRIFDDYKAMTMLPYVMKQRMWNPSLEYGDGENVWLPALHNGLPVTDSPYS
jgi:hypothetical protein